MLKGKTNSGFKFEIDEEELDDYELLEMLCEIDKGNTSLITDTAEKMLGKKQLKKLKEHVRDEKGRVSARKMMEEIEQILSGNRKGKN